MLTISYDDQLCGDRRWAPDRLFDEEPADEVEQQADTETDRLGVLVSYLPAHDQALLWRHYVLEETQVQIARRLGCTQPTLCDRLQRLRATLARRLSAPHVLDDRFAEFLIATRIGKRPLSDPERDVLTAIVQRYETQSSAARRHGRAQWWARERIEKVRRYAAAHPEWADVHAVLSSALSHVPGRRW